MVNSVVERATSDMLIGPDWAMNIEICDILNHDPSQAKAIVKDIKKRLGSKNSKVQLLTLTLLETIVKNCGDIVHIHVAEKDIPHEMVKIVKKKPDFHVKEKILILIDTWQDAFGGPRARYPQFYAAYQELLRSGAVFPQRAENSAPIFTPPQTQPLASNPQNLRNPHYQQDAGTSAESEFPALSLSEIQNARGIMDVLSEMLNALDPVNKDALRQEVIVDLVERCHTYKQRVVHLVNVTADESLLCQGLALNDDLERILAKHEAIASGTPIRVDIPVTVTAGAVVDVDGPVVDARRNRKQSLAEYSNFGSLTRNQSLLPVPPAGNGLATLVSLDPKMDLLSGDNYNSPTAEPSLALVPIVQPQPASPASEQNALILFDTFSNTSNASNSANANGQTQSLTSQSSYPNGRSSNVGLHHNEQSLYMNVPSTTWNGQVTNQQQPTPSPDYGAQSGRSLPPPPWEAQLVDESSPVTGSQYPHQMQVTQVVVSSAQINELPQRQFGNDQVAGMFIQPITGSQLSAINSQVTLSNHLGLHQPHQLQGGSFLSVVPQPMQNGQMTSIYSQSQQTHGYGNQYSLSQQSHGYGNQYRGYVYDYGQPQQAQYIQQRSYGLALGDGNGLRNSSYQVTTTSSYVPPSKPTKPEDKLFGDLVDMAKFRSTKTT